MLLLIARLRAIVLFYRSLAPFTLGITALILGFVWLPALHEGRAGVLPTLLLVKLATGPAVWYLSERMSPDQYWLYYNLGLSRRFLWTGVAVLDGIILFLTPALVVRAIYG